MINKDTVRSIVEEWLDGKEYFLVDIEISPDDRARRRRKEVQRRTQSRRGQRLHCDGAGEAESGRQEAPTTRGDRLHLPDGQSEIYKILNKFQISYGSSKKRRRGEHVRLFQGV